MPSIIDLLARPEVPREGRRGRVAAPVESRLEKLSESQPDGCVLWAGSVTNEGYGQMTFARKGYKTERLSVHRVAYELAKGRIPDGMVIDHLCRNRRCINVSHLEVVTQRENVMRSPIAMGALNAAKTHCAQGHEYTPENTYIFRSGPPRTTTMRVCRTCRRRRNRNYAARKRAAS